jgi:hypothetical protein
MATTNDLLAGNWNGQRLWLTSAFLEIENTILLEDWTQHRLDDNTWAWVGDKGRLFMQLLGEEVDPQVSVLASGSWSGDADDLTRSTLEDQEIANADVVGRNGDSVWGSRGFDNRAGALSTRLRASTYLDVNFFLLMVMVVVVMMVSVEDTISRTVETMAEWVVVTWLRFRSDEGMIAEIDLPSSS